MNVQEEPWKEVMSPKCKVVGAAAAPISTGTGALIVLGVIAYVVFELDKRVPR